MCETNSILAKRHRRILWANSKSSGKREPQLGGGAWVQRNRKTQEEVRMAICAFLVGQNTCHSIRGLTFYRRIGEACFQTSTSLDDLNILRYCSMKMTVP